MTDHEEILGLLTTFSLVLSKCQYMSDTTPPFPNPKDLLSNTILSSSDPEELLVSTMENTDPLSILNSDIVDDNDSLRMLKLSSLISRMMSLV